MGSRSFAQGLDGFAQVRDGFAKVPRRVRTHSLSIFARIREGFTTDLRRVRTHIELPPPSGQGNKQNPNFIKGSFFQFGAGDRSFEAF